MKNIQQSSNNNSYIKITIIWKCNSLINQSYRYVTVQHMNNNTINTKMMLNKLEPFNPLNICTNN